MVTISSNPLMAMNRSFYRQMSTPAPAVSQCYSRLLLTAAVSVTIIGLTQTINYCSISKEPSKSRWSKATKKTKEELKAPFTWTRDKLQHPSYKEKTKGLLALAVGVIGIAELAYWIACNDSLIMQACNAI